MSFGEPLAKLLQDVEGAEGAVMVAYDGEPVVEVVGQMGRLDHYGIQLLGAQIRVSLTRIGDLHRKLNLTEPQQVTFRMGERTLFVSALNEDYFVLLSVRNGHGMVAAEYKLDAVAKSLMASM